MSSEHLAIRTVEAPVEAKVVVQQQPALPAGQDLEMLVGHVAQFHDTRFLLRLTDILSEETGATVQARVLDAGGLELTSPGLPRPEVWRIDGESVAIQQQADGQYQPVERSVFFPVLTAINLLHLLHHQERRRDEEALLAAFRQWVRKQLGLPHQPFSL